jgi:hypothetical protein
VAHVIDQLVDQNRTNALIVPAHFYAGETTMRDLERQASGFLEKVTIHWLPGLGGQTLPALVD